MIKLLIGGSPCTHWSIAQSKNRETKAEGLGWELFRNFVIAKEKFKPDYFLYENNWSASKEIKEQIQEELDCKLMRINSNLVSAQNRDRFYVFNWEVEQPEDRGILLKYILESGTVDREKSLCVTRRYAGFSGSQSYLCRRYFGKSMGQAVFEGDFDVIKNMWKENPHFETEEKNIRQMTLRECERLQTLPDGYTDIDCIPTKNKYEAIGNGWTAEVVIHILNGILKNVPKDEKIVVLSMYDGIGTGRYCLDKMGFTNVEYHAYEIDKYAIQVAMHNYPDIIQHGDAFQVRNEDWKM